MSETVKQKVYAALSRDEWKPLLKVFESLEVSEYRLGLAEHCEAPRI